MRIQLKKGRDGKSTLACVRADGSRTWAKLHPFFPLHDMTHCAVESALGFDEAFYGLIASGWDIDDFAVKGVAKRVPPQAMWAEHIVGVLDTERAVGELLSADQFNEVLCESTKSYEGPAFRRVTDAELKAIRLLRSQLFALWKALPDGETLEIPFPAIGD